MSNSAESQVCVDNSDNSSNNLKSEQPPRVPYDYEDPDGLYPEEMKATARSLKMRVEDFAVFQRARTPLENIPRDPFYRRNMLAYMRKKETPPPKWMMHSGLMEGMPFEPEERRKRLRHLNKALVLMIRRELMRAAADPFKGERGIFWEPVYEVCDQMEIAPSLLSRMLVDFSGNNLKQTIDGVRAEGLWGKLRDGVRGFLLGKDLGSFSSRKDAKTLRAQRNGEEGEGAQGAVLGDKWAVWRGIRKWRRDEDITLDGWARGFGFANYKRMYRACVVVYGKSPFELEREVIEGELKKEVQDVQEKEKVWTVEEMTVELRGLEPFVVIMQREMDERVAKNNEEGSVAYASGS